MKKYIATYENGKGEIWSLAFYADNYRQAAKEARSHHEEYGKLFSLRLAR